MSRDFKELCEGLKQPAKIKFLELKCLKQSQPTDRLTGGISSSISWSISGSEGEGALAPSDCDCLVALVGLMASAAARPRPCLRSYSHTHKEGT